MRADRQLLVAFLRLTVFVIAVGWPGGADLSCSLAQELRAGFDFGKRRWLAHAHQVVALLVVRGCLGVVGIMVAILAQTPIPPPKPKLIRKS